jgi:hypothetical protein
VVSILGKAGDGAPVARAHLVYENGAEARADLRFGNLELLPLPQGQGARLTIQPRRGINAGFGVGRSGTVTVSGGIMGVVLDGRGRPIRLPADSGRRREQLKKWRASLGA